MKWQQFWDSFSSMIDENDRLSPIAKQQYLRSYLTGDAQRLADGLRMTSDTYPLLVTRLKERYGDPELAIFSHFDAMLTMECAGSSASDLQRVYDECESNIGSLVVLGLSEDTFGRVFTPIILSKLTRETRVELHRKKGQGKWTLATLRQLLKDEIYALEMGRHALGSGESGDSGAKRGKSGPKPNTGSSMVINPGKKKSKAKKCFYCGDAQHYSDECKAFPDLDNRLKKVGNRCRNCLGQTHDAGKPCLYKRRCYFCREAGHHQSLCPQKLSAGKLAKGASGLLAGGSLASTDLPRPAEIGVAQEHSSGHEWQSKLGAKPLTSELIAIGGFEDDERTTRRYQSYELTIHGRNGQKFIIVADGTDTVTPPAEACPTAILAKEHPILKQVPLAQPITGANQEIVVDLLVGGDYYYDLVYDERINCGKGLILLDSVFGYVAAGCLQRPKERGGSDTTLLIERRQVQKPEFDLERFWRLEEIGIKDPPDDQEDQKAVELFNATVQFDDSTGRYMVKWPWRTNVYDLPYNLGLSLGRLKSCLRRLQSSEQHMKLYCQVIQTQVERGIIEEAPRNPDGDRIHYMPHHHVLNPDSNTTPLRVVHDASCKARATIPSLNACMYRGPALWEHLCELLLRFRLHDIALVSDIEKAFLMIGLQKPDRDVARFLWVWDTDKPATGENLVHYRFTRVCFGVVASSFLLSAVLTHHCQKVGTKVSLDLLNHCYVNNIIGGKESTSEAVQFYKESKEILLKAGMNLREWYSNDKTVRNTVPREEQGKGTVLKVLSLKWNTESDTLLCRIKHASESKATTKRTMLQQVSSLYDPCGYFAPVTLAGKMIIQQLWVEKRGWDGRLSPEVCKLWDGFHDSMEKVPSFEMPRKYPGFVMSEKARNELHCFCDASTKAYGAAVYLRSTLDGSSSVNLVFAKCRVSPVKKITVPQLELVAVKVGCQLQEFVKHALKLPFAETVIWYVPTAENPADLPTRGMTFEALVSSQLWWHGPDWLQSGPHLWPPNPLTVLREDGDTGDDTVDGDYTAQANALPAIRVSDGFMDSKKYSSLPKLLHVTAYVFRFIRRSQRKPEVSETSSASCTAQEIQSALSFWIKRVQTQQLSPFYRKNLAGQDKVVAHRFGIHIDSGILKCGGRLGSGDWKVRSAVIRLPGKRTTNRPLKKLYPLEADDENEKVPGSELTKGSPAKADSTKIRRPSRAAADASRAKTRRILADDDESASESDN